MAWATPLEKRTGKKERRIPSISSTIPNKLPKAERRGLILLVAVELPSTQSLANLYMPSPSYSLSRSKVRFATEIVSKPWGSSRPPLILVCATGAIAGDELPVLFLRRALA
tara:strand:+ start:253 stop:585 length:333 start_codon:yes stop_codon:yes gene_type:complete